MSLIVHTGGYRVSEDQMRSVATPEATETFTPVPHGLLLDTVVEACAAANLTVVDSAHALAREGSRYFGFLQVTNCQADQDWGLALGLRNTHDQSYAASICVGSHVFVCDNLAFSGEVVLGRKHTRHVQRDLPALVTQAMGAVMDHRGVMEARLTTYKSTEVSEDEARACMVRALEAQVITATRLPKVLEDWRHPRHPEHEAAGRTAWRLMQAFTEHLKGVRPQDLPKRGSRLHGVLDSLCGLDSIERSQVVDTTAVALN